MSKRSNVELLTDIIDSIDKIMKYTYNMNMDEFLTDEKTLDAVARNFEIIGEAANSIDNEFQKLHSNVEWRRIIGLRNRIIHDYFGVDYKIVWQIINTKFEDFRSQIQVLIKVDRY